MLNVSLSGWVISLVSRRYGKISFSSRYYLGLIMYLWIGTLYANVMNFDFVWEELGSLGVKVSQLDRNARVMGEKWY